MLQTPLAPYLLWAKSRQPAPLDLAGSNLFACTLVDLPGARDAVDLTAPNDAGYPPLVEQIAARYGVDPDRVATANGCSGANFLVVAALVGPGDEVLVEQPAYDPLIGACHLMGARVRRFRRPADARFQVDTDDLRRQVSPTTRLVIVTSPHNPSGVRIDRDALFDIGEVAARVGAHVLVDEVYQDAAALAANAAAEPAALLGEAFVSTNSLTKLYGLAGLRCGWAVGAPALAERLRRTRDVVENAGTAPANLLSALAFARLPALAERARGLLGANLQVARPFFAAHPQLELVEPPSASIAFPRLRGVPDAGPFVGALLERHGVAVAPGRFFDSPAHFRVSLAGATTVLRDGLERLGEALAAR